ncbi:hypothetical protein GCM10009825_24390 [Arthrobacter humicola]|uniref:Uncharacterized protein n=1 Tax=Arthrobacter humicola TaxID=409291 RepID=A0ABN2Z7U8_9MICC
MLPTTIAPAVDWATVRSAADVDAGAELAAALLEEGAGAADVDVVVLAPPQPDNSAARANAVKPRLRCFFIAAP